MADPRFLKKSQVCVRTRPITSILVQEEVLNQLEEKARKPVFLMHRFSNSAANASGVECLTKCVGDINKVLTKQYQKRDEASVSDDQQLKM